MANSSPFVHQKRLKSAPWCSRRKELQALQKKLQTDLTDEEKKITMDDYKVIRTLFKKEIRNAKSVSWSAYVDKVVNNLDMAKFIPTQKGLFPTQKVQKFYFFIIIIFSTYF